MITTFCRYFLAILASLIIVAATFWIAVTHADASTTQCESGPFGHYCGDLVSGAGDAADVYRTAAAVDNPVIGWHDDPGDAASDFAVLTSPAGGGLELAYTPAGKWSGLCASDPAGGYPEDPAYPDGIVLRGCNGSKFQTWTYTTAPGPATPAVLANAATSLVLTDEGFDHQLQDAAPVTGDTAQAWTLAS
jgi:hypothetical protein